MPQKRQLKQVASGKPEEPHVGEAGPIEPETRTAPDPWSIATLNTPAFLWRGRGSDEIWVGLGVLREADSLEECWDLLNSIDCDEASGIEPICFCSVAFDPHRKLTGIWSGFAPRRYVLPEMLIRWRNGWHEAVLVGTQYDSEGHSTEKLLTRACHVDSISLPPVTALSLTEFKESSGFSRTAWDNAIHVIHDEIRSGTVAKAVLARSIDIEAAEPFSAAAILQALSATPDSFLFSQHVPGGGTFLGASPERLFRLDGDLLEVDSLAGTRPRGADDEEDERLSRELLESSKERMEHEFVTDFITESLVELCDEITAAHEPEIKKLPHVQHLHTRVEGHLRGGVTLDEILDALHPTPAVCGTPQVAARDLIRKLEPSPRGLYAGAIGYVGLREAEFAVTIRSALIEENVAHLFAGSGIVAGSDPESEWRETANKMKAMRQALAPN